ncbi:MAG: hypothetical protein JWR22_1366 [Herminiimonas sp.]|nr:hypothetical protein [Herminiimonas sp.]
MKCEHCGGENVGSDLVCNTCGTHAVPRRRASNAGPDDLRETSARAFAKAEFHTVSGLPLETDVLPMPPVRTASAATPLRPAEPRRPRPSGIEAPPPGMPGIPPSAPPTPRHNGEQQGPAEPFFSNGETALPPWATPQIEVAARESSNLNRAIISLMVAGAVAFGFSMEWWTGVGKPSDAAGVSSAAKSKSVAKVARSSAPGDAASGSEQASSASLLESEKPGSVALALPMLESETPPPVAAAYPTANQSLATTPAESNQVAMAAPVEPTQGIAAARAEPAPSKAGTPVEPLPLKATAPVMPNPPQAAAPVEAAPPVATAAPSVRPIKRGDVPARAGAAPTAATAQTAPAARAQVQTLDVRRAQQQAALKQKGVYAKRAKRRSTEATQLAAGSPREERLNEMDRLQLQAFSETSRDRVGRAPPPPRLSPEMQPQSARTPERPTRHVARSAYAQCERLGSFLEREQCKWQVCDGRWGQNDCPSYKRASVY